MTDTTVTPEQGTTVPDLEGILSGSGMGKFSAYFKDTYGKDLFEVTVTLVTGGERDQLEGLAGLWHAFSAGQEAGPDEPVRDAEQERLATDMAGTAEHPLSYGAM
jgi:hypothetical protein